jgi:hypothetical protein
LKLTVSGGLLVSAGMPYTLQGGSLFAKLHPGTYAAGLAMLVRMTSYARARNSLIAAAALQQDFVAFMLAITFCLMYAFCLTGTGGLISLLDTFLPAGMVGFALAGASEQQLVFLRKLLGTLFLVNAVIALIEAVAGTAMIPMPSYVNDTPPADPGRPPEFRPTALYDHPLTGAAATMLALMLCRPPPEAASRRFRHLLFYVHKGVLFVALLAFGGRMALLLYVAGVVAVYAQNVLRRAIGRRLTWQDLLPALVAPALSVPLIALSLGMGVAGRLQAHLYWDVSAQTRVDVMRLFGLLSPQQFLFGCRRADWQALVENLRLGYGVGGIENCWLLMFVTLGLLCFPIFLFGMGALLRGLWRAGDGQARLMVVTSMLVVSTSNSLGRKSMLLMLLVGCVAASGRGWRFAGSFRAIRGAAAVSSARE